MLIEPSLDDPCSPGSEAARRVERGTKAAGHLKRLAPETGVSAIITNPPYALAREFIERALRFDDISHSRNALAHHAANRAHLFADCAMFAKVVLTKRIRWFEDSN